MLWTCLCAYYTSPLSPRELSELWVRRSGLFLLGGFIALGTFFGLMGLTPLVRLNL